MWLWILSILFLMLVWGTWYLLIPTDPGSEDIFPLWIPLVATAIVVLILGTIYLVRRIRALRAARALEKAIAQQAQEQALNAKPEDRAEIQALHKQFQEGIDALKRSKLGAGASGERALYELPWYVIVGPPGAGKTTALRHSGLSFPFLDPSGGGVRGVGGTRNCDWWFTNDAILLDTAGRYTTEEADHDEWIGFLEQLLKYRYHKPINGVLVAVSVSDLLDASDEQIQEMASKIRSRVDEMQVHLKMIVPVYITFTKIDLVAGFVEFFGDLKKSERTQAWGATFRLDADKSAPGKMFDTEFDLLVQKLHMRGLRRMTTERSRGTKEKVYQFPLEFAAIKRNLSDFLQAAFAPGAAGASAPVLRGFYFTSGTQEGKPLDRIVGAMGRAYGLKVAEPEDDGTPKEAKSYFLKDVFTTVIFPDQDVAARTEAEIRRRRTQRLLGAAAAIAVGVLFATPAILAFANNRELVAETDVITTEAGEINWNDSKGTLGKIDKLQKLREHTEKLDRWHEEGPPFAYGWMMYQGDKLYEPTQAQYLAALDKGFVGPVKAKLEAKLKGATGAKYINDYNNLKTYILLNDREHLDEHWEWQIGRLTGVWAEVLRETSDANDLSEADLKYLLEPHVAYFVDLQRRGQIKNPPQTEPAVIEKTRDILTRVGPLQALYERFVTVLIDQKYDEAGAATPDNMRYPPVTLADAFADRQEVLSVLRSRTKERDGKWFEVQGPYTARGHDAVLKSLKDGEQLLDREKWVVPLTQEERLRGDRIKRELERVRQDYDQEYIRQWVEFFRDIDTATPITNRDAIAEYKVLTSPDWPYKRLLQVLADNTQFALPPKSKIPGQQPGGLMDQIRQRVASRLEARMLGLTLADLGANGAKTRYDPVPDKFKSMVEFGVNPPPPPPADGTTPPPPAPDPQLTGYVGDLEKLESEMQLVEEGPANSDTKNATKLFTEAVKNTESKIQKIDPTGRELLSPLLLNPLRAGYKAALRNAGGSASGLWEVEVWPSYRDQIKNRYPFNLQASKDASYEEFVQFFAPKEGTLWGFYENHLKDLHIIQEHDFIPQPQLEGSPKPAKPFTPFNGLLYNCLKRSHEITDAMWSGGKGDPHLEFFINLKTVSPIVSTVELVVDGQERVYKNEKEFWHKFKWPGEEKGARMTVKGAGGLDESIVREGPWGLFRLFESADEITAVKDKDDQFIVTWQMTAPPVTVTMQVRPTRANHPFPLSFFRGMNCPPTIGDKFGTAK